MALQTILRGFWDDPWEGIPMPSRLFDQQFGNILSQGDLAPSGFTGQLFPAGYRSRLPMTTGKSEVVNSDAEFRVSLDVQHFKPEEINIKTKDNRVIITARHEERPDEHGFIMREFKRQYVLPKDVDPNTVTSVLSRDGVLTIKAPKMALEAPQERAIPITHEPA